MIPLPSAVPVPHGLLLRGASRQAGISRVAFPTTDWESNPGGGGQGPPLPSFGAASSSQHASASAQLQSSGPGVWQAAEHGWDREVGIAASGSEHPAPGFGQDLPWPEGLPVPGPALSPQFGATATAFRSPSLIAVQAAVHLEDIEPVFAAMRANLLPAGAEMAAFRGALAVVATQAAGSDAEVRRVLEEISRELEEPPIQRRRRRRRRAKRTLQIMCSCTSPSRLSVPTEDKCTICLEDLEVGENVRTLPCNHVLHETCSMRFFGTSGGMTRCPVCRAHVRRNPAGS